MRGGGESGKRKAASSRSAELQLCTFVIPLHAELELCAPSYRVAAGVLVETGARAGAAGSAFFTRGGNGF